MAFVIEQFIGKICTCMLVQIKKVSNTGGIVPVGLVNVQPMVNQIDGDGNPTPHGIINNVPYMRLQGGSNAIILDPQVGDIGVCLFASRDISTVKSSKKVSNPGSFRRYDWADGLYIGGFLNGSPSQYVAFASGGITITSPTAVTLAAPSVAINSPSVAITGASLTHNGKNIGDTHKHSGVQTGAGNTGNPI